MKCLKKNQRTKLQIPKVGLPSIEYILKDSIKNEFNLKIFQTKNSIIFHARLIGDLSETLNIEETDFE